MLAPLPPGWPKEEGEERGEGERDEESEGHQGEGERWSGTCGPSAGGNRHPHEDQQAADKHSNLDATGAPPLAPCDALGDIWWDVGWDVVPTFVRAQNSGPLVYGGATWHALRAESRAT